MVIDLSMPFYEGMPKFPSSLVPEYKLEFTAMHSKTVYKALGRFTTSTHNGTHIDAPLHWVRRGKTIDSLPLEKFVGYATIIYLPDKKSFSPITLEDLDAHPEVQKGDILIIRTDWSNRLGTPQFFTEPPYLTLSAVDWILDKKVKLLGVDLPCIEDVRVLKTGISPVHKKLLENEIPIIEGLVNLDSVGEGRIFLIAVPINLKGADAAPARVIGIKKI